MQSFLNYGMNGNQMSPEQRRQMMQQQLASQIMGQPAQNIGQGMSQLALGAGMGLDKMKGPFPDAPGGVKPDFATRFKNMFSFGNNGGLF